MTWQQAARTAAPEPAPPLVPRPGSVLAGDGGGCVLDARTSLDAGPGTEDTARWLRATLGPALGLDLPPAPSLVPAASGSTVIRLRVDDAVRRDTGDEGHLLHTHSGGADLTGADPAGVFWAAQTLRQLLGPDAYRRARLRGGAGPAPGAGPAAAGLPPDRERADGARSLPALRITDAPRFRWRGLMLDVARHFTPKDGVLRILDLLAAHKLNVLHLHLTDDQGWRAEIRRHPKLTEIGATRARTRVGHRASPLWDERAHGGHYTQGDLREIVAYAADRHITVVPEIELPGHSQAAIAAYPELGNTDAVDTAALGVWTDWGVSPHLLAPGEAVLRFYEEVWEELLEIFPSRFVHVGGDECPKDEWRASPYAQARMRELGLGDEDALQAWFVRHFGAWFARRGRRLVGWDEILQGGLAEGATVSSWRGYAGGVAAARAGHDVVMCPEQHVYLDYRQDAGDAEPVPIGYVRTLRDVYGFEPVPKELAGSDAEGRVLGAQANMWTEVTEDQQRVDYQLFPRLAAFAEVVWSPLPPPAQRDFADFDRRLSAAHYARLDAMGVNYRPPSGPRPWQQRPGIAGRPRSGEPPKV